MKSVQIMPMTCIVLSSAPTDAAQPFSDMKLWYDTPPINWEQGYQGRDCLCRDSAVA